MTHHIWYDDEDRMVKVTKEIDCTGGCNMIEVVASGHDVTKYLTETAKKIGLKPCPFCGKKKIEIIVNERIAIRHNLLGCHAFCLNCGGTTGYREFDQAIELWNRRLNE